MRIDLFRNTVGVKNSSRVFVNAFLVDVNSVGVQVVYILFLLLCIIFTSVLTYLLLTLIHINI
jgi:hypothetical protein